MISNVNDKPVTGALCLNCRNVLEPLELSANKGKQVVYICQNENCPRRGIMTVAYFPPADIGSGPATV